MLLLIFLVFKDTLTQELEAAATADAAQQQNAVERHAEEMGLMDVKTPSLEDVGNALSDVAKAAAEAASAIGGTPAKDDPNQQDAAPAIDSSANLNLTHAS